AVNREKSAHSPPSDAAGPHPGSSGRGRFPQFRIGAERGTGISLPKNNKISRKGGAAFETGHPFGRYHRLKMGIGGEQRPGCFSVCASFIRDRRFGKRREPLARPATRTG